jgi:D-alanine transaminase
VVLRETTRRNRVGDGILYVQVNRGTWRRDHPFPPDHVAPSVMVTAREGLGPKAAVVEAGVRVITLPDLRWRRRDIKSVSLLPNVLAKQQAREAGAYEAWQVDDAGLVTEGSSTNAWIVTQDGALVTRPLSHDILAGVTRRTLIDLARADGLTVEERSFTVEEAQRAREAFISSTTSLALSVVAIDDVTIANGQPGSITRRLRALYLEHMRGPGAEPWL